MKENSKLRNEKRRRYYIKKEMQRRFILSWLGLLIAGGLAANGLLYLFLQRWINNALYRVHINVTSVNDVIMTPLFITNLIVFLLAAAASTLFVFLGSRRMERQFSRFSEGMQALGNGDLTVNVGSSPCSDLADLFHAFNSTVGRLKDDVILLGIRFDEIEQIAEAAHIENSDMRAKLWEKMDSLEKEVPLVRPRQ